MQRRRFITITQRGHADKCAADLALIYPVNDPMTLNGFTFGFDHDAEIYIMLAGNEPILGDRFTVNQLADYLWSNRHAFNAADDIYQPWPVLA